MSPYPPEITIHYSLLHRYRSLGRGKTVLARRQEGENKSVEENQRQMSRPEQLWSEKQTGACAPVNVTYA
jgi:hypothetical protein